MLRYRGPRPTISQVKALDAFPKIPETYTESSAGGGALSIVTFFIIIFLTVSEMAYFLDTRLKYRYTVDVEHEEKVSLNFDITVATECRLIGADVVDVTGQAWVFEEGIVERPVSFKLSQREASNRISLQYAKRSLLHEKDGAKLSEVAIKAGFNATELYFMKIKDEMHGAKDACRFYGNVQINKVTGNFHIIAGKSLPIRGGHAHLSFIGDSLRYNFSHRINHLSFGDMKVGFINVLDGDEFITSESGAIFNYYLNAVSTRINSRRINTDTYQFSVSEQTRVVDHSSGSHGMPGIFFKYTFSPIAVNIDEQSMPLGRFLVRLCGIIGGVFATSAIINNIVIAIANCLRTDSGVKPKAPVSPAASLIPTLQTGNHTGPVLSS